MSGPLDVITIGRSLVDLYGALVGGRLKDMGPLERYVGGSPTNTAAESAAGAETGADHPRGQQTLGRFTCEDIARGGVDVCGVRIHSVSRTGIVFLGIRDDKQFPLLFYREN